MPHIMSIPSVLDAPAHSDDPYFFNQREHPSNVFSMFSICLNPKQKRILMDKVSLLGSLPDPSSVHNLDEHIAQSLPASDFFALYSMDFR